MENRILRHSVGESSLKIDIPLWTLAFIEAGALFFSVYAAAELRFLAGTEHDPLTLGSLYTFASTVTLVLFSIMVSLGLYQADLKAHGRITYFLFLMSHILGFIVLSVLFYLFPQLYLGQGIFIISMVLSFIGLISIRYLYFLIWHSDATKKQVLVLGAGSRTTQITNKSHLSRIERSFNIVGYVPRGDVDQEIDRSLVLKENKPLLAIAKSKGVDEIVVGVRQRRGGVLDMRELMECRMEGIHVVSLSTFYEREMGKVQLESVNPSWFVYSDGFDRGRVRNITKRVFDLSVSLALLILSLPILVLTTFLIKLESVGPVFYRQQRIGECGHPFEVLKFRSMKINAEKDGVPQWAKKNDSRITAVGRIIRMARIDELPQIFNVIRGDMSFVGPRPERPHFVSELGEKIPYYAARHSVKPGITGWAQICYPYGASVEDAREKLQYDLYYAKNHNLFLDLTVLLQTAQVVLFGKGAR